MRLNLPKEKTFVGPALLWKRAAAFLVDIMIINFFVLFPFRGIFENMLPKDYSFSEAYRLLSTGINYGLITSVSSVISVLMIMYFFLMESRMRQTIGKMLMKIYVVSDNKELKAWQAFVRNLVFIPIFPFILLWILDPLFMFFTKTNQRLGEILSRTRVVERYSFEQ